MITCKNCYHEYSGNYCSQCGQSAETHAMNAHFLWHDLQHGLLHVDKGIFFTIKELFTRPGYTIREYIEGRRIRHFRPFSLVLVLAGICGFLYHYFHIDLLADKVKISGSGTEYNAMAKTLSTVNEWMVSHYALVVLIQLPLFSAATFLAFRKYKNNYIEHLVINAFLAAPRLIMHILIFPLYYALTAETFSRTNKIIDIIWFGLIIWAFLQFYNQHKRTSVFGKSLLSLLLAVIFNSVVLMITVLLAFKL